jgi:uncharacterized protein (TIGR02001 family)
MCVVVAMRHGTTVATIRPKPTFFHIVFLGYFMTQRLSRPTLLSLAVASTLAISAPAFAQTAPAPAPAPAPTPEHTFSGNIGVASSYIYRGLNQSDYKPAIQMGLDYSHASGFYLGAWGSSIRWLKDFGVSSGNAEIDLYGGYKGSVGDFGYDVGVLHYQYTGSPPAGGVNPDTTEIYVAGTYKWATLKYSHSLTDTFGVFDSKNSYYVDLTATIPVIDNVSMIAHVGYQGFKGPFKDLASYTDYKVAGVYDFGNGLTIEGGVTGTDADKAGYTPPGKKFTGKTTPYAILKFSKTF